MRIRRSDKASALWGVMLEVDGNVEYHICDIPARQRVGEYVMERFGVSILDDNVAFEPLVLDITGDIIPVTPTKQAA